jgi:hypothetical protein
MLGQVLAAIGELQTCAVLIEDVDRTLFARALPEDRLENRRAPADNDPVRGILQRMSGQILHWMDRLPPGLIVLVTTAAAAKLPAQWSRRFELTLPLREPDGGGAEFRADVFAALFRRFRMPDLAADEMLMRDLATRTHPSQRLRSPMARLCRGESLRNHAVRLRTGAEIEQWIQESILFHSRSGGEPEHPEFWREAALPAS